MLIFCMMISKIDSLVRSKKRHVSYFRCLAGVAKLQPNLTLSSCTFKIYPIKSANDSNLNGYWVLNEADFVLQKNFTRRYNHPVIPIPCTYWFRVYFMKLPWHITCPVNSALSVYSSFYCLYKRLLVQLRRLEKVVNGKKTLKSYKQLENVHGNLL